MNVSDTVIRKFVAALGGLSRRDLYLLAAMLRSSEQREAAISVITGLAALKTGSSGENKMKSAPIQHKEDAERPRNGSFDKFEELRNGFFALLNDRTAFPSTEDVVAAINRCFRFNWKYADLKRDSRNRVLVRAWKTLATLPQQEREERLRLFCDRYKRFEDVGGYKELFKLLSRSE